MATQPTVQALMLFARGHDALLQNRGYTAIGLLERAVRIDPYSYELYYELGRAYLSVGNSVDRATEVFEKAASLRPGALAVHLQLARIYLLRGDADDAIHHLRIARLPDEYQQEEDSAAATDLLLARSLQQKGYDRAASDEYELVLEDMQHPTMAMRSNMELEFLLAHPEVIHEQLGELAEAMGDDATALSEYQQSAEMDRDNFQRGTWWCVLLRMGRAVNRRNWPPSWCGNSRRARRRWICFGRFISRSVRKRV